MLNIILCCNVSLSRVFKESSVLREAYPQINENEMKIESLRRPVFLYKNGSNIYVKSMAYLLPLPIHMAQRFAWAS